MRKEKIFHHLRETPLFRSFSDSEIDTLIQLGDVYIFSKHVEIMREDEFDTKLYVILDGMVEVVKADENGILHQISILKKDETIGEMSLIDRSPRSATARAFTKLTALVIPFEKIEAHPELKEKLIPNISKKLSERLRISSEQTVKSLQAQLEVAKIRIEMEGFFIKIFVLFSIYIFLLATINEVSKNFSTTIVSLPWITLLTLTLILHIKQSPFPVSFFGLNVQNWKKNVVEGIVYTIPILVLSILLKWLLIKYVPAFSNASVFTLSKKMGPRILFVAYLLFVPLQEIIRGLCQSSLKVAISSKYAAQWSILLTSIIFSAFHALASPTYMLASFVVGLFWGWLYNRQWSVVGPIVSHALIGGFCLEFLGFGKLFVE